MANTYQKSPIDLAYQHLSCLKAVEDLLVQVGNQSNDLHLVGPADLSTLIHTIHNGLEQALDSLDRHAQTGEQHVQ